MTDCTCSKNELTGEVTIGKYCPIHGEAEMIEYFVSYSCMKEGEGTGFGRLTIGRETPIRSMLDVKEIEQELCEDENLDSVIIINFQRFEK